MVGSFVSITFDSPQLGKQNKIYKALEYWSRDMLKFDFLEKGLKKVSPQHFVYDFSRKMFLMEYSFNWPNLIAWLPLVPGILVNVCVTSVC